MKLLVKGTRDKKKTKKKIKQTHQLSCSSHLNERTEDMREKDSKVQEKNKNLDSNHPLSPQPHTDINQPRRIYPISIICNSNTMDMEFLVKITQPNKCWSVRNDEIFNLHLGSGAGTWSSIPCLLQDAGHITDSIHPKN